MGLSSSKSKTTSTSTPLEQYSPYINQALASSQKVFNDNQGNLQQLGAQAGDVFSGLKDANAAATNIYTGNGPSADTYARLKASTANDPSMGLLTDLANNPFSNPAIDRLKAVGDAGVNPLSNGYYSDVLSGKYLDAGNPYLSGIIQNSNDAVTKAVNQRFSAAGQGTGMSTPYVDLLSRNLANSENSLRYTDYDNQLNRMTQVGGQSDAQYNSSKDRSLAAAQALASTYASDRAANLAAAQALGAQNAADNNTALSAANADTQAILSALGLTGTLSAGELQALSAEGTLPFTGVNAYSNLINALTSKYGNTDSTTKSSQSFGSVLGGLAGAGLSGLASGVGGGLVSGGLGGLLGSGASLLPNEALLSTSLGNMSNNMNLGSLGLGAWG